MPGQEPGAPNAVAAAHHQQPPPPPPQTHDQTYPDAAHHQHQQQQPPPPQQPNQPPQHQQHQQPQPPQPQPQHQQQQPQQPTYPSLAYPAGPSQHQPPYPPNNYPYNPYYAAQQQFPHHHGQQRPHHPNPGTGAFQPAFRYDNYPGYYQPQFYPPYGQMPMPGPGPGTMQNGYYVGGGANFQRPYGGFDGDQKFGHEDDGSAVYHGNPQFAPQQPFYPPGHPYAYGVGVGYQQPGMYNGMGYRPDGGYMMGDQQHGGGPNGTSAPHVSAASSKGLNPAAQGFNYPVRKNEPPSRTASSANVNGNANGPVNATAQLPNGHASTPTVVEQPAPAQVPEKAQDAGSLGLSLEPPPSVSEPAATTTTTTTDDSTKSAPAPSSTPSASAPAKVDQPATSDNVASTHPPSEHTNDSAPSASSQPPPQPSPPAEPSAAAQPEGLTFTGASLAGLSSPSPSSSTMPRRQKLTSDPVRLRPHRPAPDAEGNSYAAHLSRFVPASVKSESVPAANNDDSPRWSSKGSSKPRGKAVYAVGVKGGRQPPPHRPLTFGDVISEPLPHESADESKTPVVTTPKAATRTAETPAATPAPAPVRSPAPAPAPVKPSSWASLLRSTHPAKSATGTPNSLSVAASSTLPSPSKSIDSLPAESVTSRVPPSEGRSTPRSPPPKPSSWAAAVGAPPTPAEDLARLLTDGLTSRPAGPPAPIVPRGLINTGNMCFANTVGYPRYLHANHPADSPGPSLLHALHRAVRGAR